jgi:hypothetical protein
MAEFVIYLDQEILALIVNNFKLKIEPSQNFAREVLVTIERDQYKVFYNLSQPVSPEKLAYILREMREKWNQDQNKLKVEGLP